ncbi:MAG: RNA polymerase sigma-70 factor [Bacteroides sp.]|nr:RNA polymerase sigma-70 factor [Bacteroides sp.]
MEQAETIIVEWLRKGNEEAYRYIYAHHYTLLCHVANEYVRDSFLAETIVGDTIFHLWEIRETVCITTSLRSYLMRAVRNRCLNHLALEHEKREIAFSSLASQEFLEEREEADIQPLGKLLERELEEEIYKAIEHLPQECRRVFSKSRFEGKTYEEIAQELHISINTVKYHIKNAIASLQRDLGKYLLSLLLWFVLP